MQESKNLQRCNFRRNDKNPYMPAITLQETHYDGYRSNDLGFSLVSPDAVPLHSAMNRSSPEFTGNIFFGSDIYNMIKSPYKDSEALSELNYRLISPSRVYETSPLDKNTNVFSNYKNLVSQEGSVSNLFGSPSPKQLKQQLNFNYDENLFNLIDSSAKRRVNKPAQDKPSSNDFSLNLYKIPNSGPRVEDVSVQAARQPLKSKEAYPVRVQTELKHLDRLFNLLVVVFTKKEIGEKDLAIGDVQMKMLNYVLQRKYLKRLTSKDLESSVDVQMSKLNGIMGSKSHKRPEECYKFIFTRVLKFLKKSFKKNFNIKQNLDEQFYGYYFAELAQKNQEPLEAYFYPLTKKENKKETLNASYFAKIFQSKFFISDMVKYVNEHLFEEYKTEIIQKLESLLLKWDGYFLEGDQKLERRIEEIKSYLMKNKRCKLPWTLDEVKEAVLRVYSLIDTHSSSNLSITLDRSALFQQ